MAVIVLDVEVAVERLREGDLRKPAFDVFTFVTQFVCGIDADATDYPIVIARPICSGTPNGPCAQR